MTKTHKAHKHDWKTNPKTGQQYCNHWDCDEKKAPKQPHELNEKNDCIHCGMIEKADELNEECPAIERKTNVQHTAGEWAAQKFDFYVRNDEGLHEVFIDSTTSLKPAKAFGYSVEEVEANARLIASAPSLLSALEGLLKHQEQDEYTKPLHFKWCKKAEQAIAKAKGEA